MYVSTGKYTIKADIATILYKLRDTLSNGKLRDIVVRPTEIIITCPNSQHADGRETNPDCHINLTTNSGVPYGFAHCFACGFSGSFVKVVAAAFETSVQFAEDWLFKNFESEPTVNTVDIDSDIVIKRNKVSSKLDSGILDNYQSYCPYLATRKLSRAVCDAFNVKYDPKYRQVIFPCYDTRDNLVMLVKRSIDFKQFYMNKDVEKPVYCLNHIIKNNIRQCLLVEGPIDCLTCYEYGAPAIATLGEMDEGQIEQINKSCIEVLYLATDNDSAGRRFRDKLRRLLNKRILVVDIQLPKNKKDVNELTKEEFQSCVKNARGW